MRRFQSSLIGRIERYAPSSDFRLAEIIRKSISVLKSFKSKHSLIQNPADYFRLWQAERRTSLTVGWPKIMSVIWA